MAIGTHGALAAFWLGSLVALYVLLRHDPAAALPALRRFSSLAVGGVAALLAAGVGFAALQLGSLADVTQTPYGRLILLKAALLASLLALAATNRFVLTPRLARGAADATAQLRRSVAIEVALVVAVLVATAVLAQTSPHAGPRVMSLNANGRVATVTLDPGRAGRNAITAVLTDARGRPLEAAAVEIEMANPAAGVEPLTRPMRQLAPGHYRHESRELAFAGTWRIEIRARIDDFEQMRWSTQFDLH